MSNKIQSALNRQRLELRTRVARMLVAVLIAPLLSLLPAVLEADFLPSAQATQLTWTSPLPTETGDWHALAMSADGRKLVGAKYNGAIWTSSDSGVTWLSRSGAGNRNWTAVAISQSSDVIYGVVPFGGVWRSADFGATWSQTTATTACNYVGVATSGTTNVSVACGNASNPNSVGAIYHNTNEGVGIASTWTLSTGTSGRNFTDLKSSFDGTKLFASVWNDNGTPNGGVYTASNGTFSYTNTMSSPLTSYLWSSVGVDLDGTKLIATTRGAGGYGSGGNVYTSTDSGATWVASSGPNGANSGGSHGDWMATAISADGSAMMAVAFSPGRITLSRDGGTTWVSQNPSGAFLEAVMCPSGGRFVAAHYYGGRIQQAQSDAATLSDLTLSSGALSQTFNSCNTSYTATVANSVSSGFTITPVKSQSNATTIQYLGATGTTPFAGNLSVGANIIRTIVTSQDGLAKSTYTVTVTRSSPGTFYVYCKNSLGENQTISSPAVVSANSLSGCYGKVILGAGITSLSQGSFLTSTQLTKIKSAPTYPADFNTGVTGIIFPAGFTTLDAHSLAGLGAVSSLAFPNSLGSIPSAVFQRSNIQTLDFSAFLGNYGSFSISGSAFPFAERPKWWRDCSAGGGIPASGYLFDYLVLRGGTAYCTPNTSATLSALTPSSGDLQPAFVSATLAYNLSVPNSVTSINFTTTLTDSRTSVSVNKIPQINETNKSFTGQVPNSIALSLGTTVIPITATAQDGITQSNYTVNVTRTAFEVPGAPTGVSGTVGNASSIVSWSAPGSNGGSAITSYTVTSSPGSLTCTTATTSCTVNGLTNGTAYTFTVRATNVAGNSAASTASASVTPVAPVTVPAAPTGVSGTVADSSSVVSWSAPGSNGGSAITSYTVTSSPGSLTCSTASTSCTVSGLTNGTAYTFIVRATNVAGNSAASTASDSVTPRTFPGAPTGVSGTVGNALSVVSWTAPGSNGGSVITSYTVTSSPGSLTCSTASTSCTVSGLTNGTAYTFIVRATNAAGNSVTSTPSASVTPVSNDATLSALVISSGSLSPTFVGTTETYTATVGNSSITITPTRTQANATITVNGTSVTSGSASGSIALNVGSNTITVVVTAQDGTTKTYTVTVTRLSNLASFSTFNFSQLTPSVVGTVDNTLNTVQLIVPVGTNVTSLVAAFTFSAGATVSVGSTAQISGTTANNFTSPVTYVVTSQDSSTVRSYSVSVSFANSPTAPQNLTANGGQGSASLSWSAPASNGGRPVTGYVIERSVDSTNWTSAGTTSETTTSLNISSLSNGTTYYFRVRATNTSGSATYNYSSVASATTSYYVACSVSGSFYVSTSIIPSRAGQNCKGTATIPQGITKVLINSFAPGTGSTAGDINRDLTAIVFPATGFAEIDQGGFMNLGLTTLTIPASVTLVGQYAFQNNPLTSVTITGGSGGSPTTLNQSVFNNQNVAYGLSTAIALTFGSGKIDIGENFGSNTRFSTVDFGSGIRSIGKDAFKQNGIAPGWIPLFPSTITSIGLNAFTYNSKMRTIRFGSETTTSITPIDRYAFDENYLKSVQYCGPQGNVNELSKYLRDYQKNAKIWCYLIAPSAPTISNTSKTNQQVTIDWTKGADLDEPLTDTYTVQYKSAGGSWITLSFETETPLSLTINNLTNGTAYTFRVAANNIAGASSYSSEVQVTPLGLALIPIPDTSTATAGGFTFNVTNYSSQSNWSATVTAGSGTVSLGTAVGNQLPVTVTNMNPGATVSVRISTTRTNYETGTADTAGTSLISALTPTFGSASVRTNGYTVPITNYDSNYSWSVIPSSGTATIIDGAVRVTGAGFATSVTAAVTATRTGYVTGSADFSATTLAALTATYYGNGNTGGSVPSDTSTYQTNATFAVLGNSGTLIKPGYTFAGWKDNLGADYQPSAQYALANAGVSFYAQWTANPYRVFYNLTEATSGTVPTDANIYAITSTANVRGNPGNLQRSGYVFAGWTDNASRTGRIYVSGDTYTVQTSDINFWAAWTPNTYTITYDVNGASGSPSKNSDSYTVGSSVARLALVGTMAKNGYNFGGWATQAVGTAISDSFTVAANTKLFAQWTIASFTLTYDLDGGTGTVDSPTAVNYLQQFNLAPATGFTKTSGGNTYAFVSWSANSATYNPGQSYFMPAANLTFVATWTRIYNVTYSFSGGSVASAIADQQKVALETITVTSTTPTRTGYNFLHWVDQSGETTTAGATYTVRDGHYLLYAQWQAISYSVTYDAAAGSPAPSESGKTIGQSFLVKAAPSREFYNFNGWFDGTNTYFPDATYLTQSSSIVFTAQWQGKVFRVSYDFNGGAGNVGGDYLHTYGSSAYSLPTTGISLTDYNFGGWSTSPGGTSVGATFAPSSDISLYAIWNIAIYRLNFNGQSGISESATAKVTIGQSLALPNATRANHTLQGWSTQQSGGSITAAGASFTPNSDATLYAQWALQVFTVTFNANSGTSESATAAFTYGSTTPLILPRATRANYVFDNWYSSAVGGYLIGAGGANFTPTGSVTIYAHWIQASLEGLGDSVKIAEVTVLAGSSSSFSAGSQGSTATVEYTADSLPDGTVITAYVQKSTTRASSVIRSDYNYVLSIVVAWLAPDGTVPDTAVGKPIVVTVTNKDIKKGSRIYKLVGTNSRVLGTATEDGRFVALLTQDPLVTVAITEPDSPTAISSVLTDATSALVSWQAPEVTGGSPISEYTATSNTGQSCVTVTTSCTITGLSAGTSYTFAVVARNVIGASNQSLRTASITTSAAPVIVPQSTNNNTNNSGGTYDASAALAAAQQKAAQAAAAAELKAAELKAAELKAAELKAAELKAASELKAAEEKAAAELKAAEEKAAAELKSAEELKAAELKALADAELAAALAAKKITPAVSLYSISPKLTLSAYDLAYLKKYLSTLKKTATVTCIGYTYTQKTSLTKATVLAKQQANAVCSIVKKLKPTLKTSILIRPSKSAPKAAVGAKWVAISYRVDGFQPKK